MTQKKVRKTKMTNKGKYKKELEDYALSVGHWGIDKKGNVICCVESDCNHCIFGEKNGECWKNRLEWLNGEYQDIQAKAEFEKEKTIVLEQMKKFAEPENAVWDLKKEHWSFAYNLYRDKIIILPHVSTKGNGIYFECIEDADKCIAEIGEDKIKKYYCGIKD